MLLQTSRSVAPLNLMERFCGQRRILTAAGAGQWAAARARKKAPRQNSKFNRSPTGLGLVWGERGGGCRRRPPPKKKNQRLNIGMQARASRDNSPPLPPRPLPPCNAPQLHLSPCSAPSRPGARGAGERGSSWKTAPAFTIFKAKAFAALKV